MIKLNAIQKTYRMGRPSTQYAREHDTWQSFLLDQDISRTTDEKLARVRRKELEVTKVMLVISSKLQAADISIKSKSDRVVAHHFDIAQARLESLDRS